MIQLEFSSKFNRSYKRLAKNNILISKKVDKSLEQFMKNPNNTGLKLEKLVGSKVWTIRVNRPIRIFFTWIETNKIALLLDIGRHDLYRKY